MKKILYLVLLCFGMAGSLHASETNRDWEFHLAYHEASDVVSTGSNLYGLLNGNLLAYDVEDGSVRTFDKLTGLSDKSIVYMDYSATQKCMVLYYQNNNIDLLYEDGTVVNIPQIKNYIEYTVTPRSLKVNGDWATVATTEGVVVLNVARAEVKGYYRIGQSVKDAVVFGNAVYAALEHELVKGMLSDNLYDFSQWMKLYDLKVTAFVPYGEGSYILVPKGSGEAEQWSGLCYLEAAEAATKNKLERVTNEFFEEGSFANDRIQFVNAKNVLTIDPKMPLKGALKVPMKEVYHQITCTSDGSYWSINASGEVVNYKLDASALEMKDTGVKVGGFGPQRDLCYKLSYAGNRLMVSGGKMDYKGGKNFPPTAMIYENGKWTNLQETGFTLNDGAVYRNVMSMTQVPDDASRLFVSSTSGVLEFKDGQFLKHYNSSNSTLEIAKGGAGSPNYTIADALTFDQNGNLWMTNYEAVATLKVMKRDGTWMALKDDAFSNIPTPEKILIDREGRVWVTSRRTTSSVTSGLYALDTKGSLENTEDDRSNFRSRVANEDGTNCNIEYVNDICEDLNGQIWLGCASGVYAVTEPESWFSSSFFIYQPKVPRNDGTNYADYLLTGIDVTAIAVDGGNRKWLGTMGSGIYLVSPDGSEVLEHHTSADSPLLSDDIYTLAINPENGDLMIGTDLGLCSYRTRITPPVGKLSKNDVKVYPNPVRPEYTGNVTVTGLTDGAEVKVVTTGSQLVARGNAVGGTFIWDVRNEASGERVAPGVYYLFIADSDGSESVAAKLVVI